MFAASHVAWHDMVWLLAVCHTSEWATSWEHCLIRCNLTGCFALFVSLSSILLSCLSLCLSLSLSVSLSPASPPVLFSLFPRGAAWRRGVVSAIRATVAQKRQRFKEDGFDLDLSYVTPRIIAMGFPGENIKGVYRNNMKVRAGATAR